MDNLASAFWPEGDTNRYAYVKSGLQRNLTGFGDTVIYGEYYRIEKDVVEANCGGCWTPGVDTVSTMWGAGVVQHIDAAAMEIYAAYRFYDAPNGQIGFAPGTVERGDFHMGQVGMRIKF